MWQIDILFIIPYIVNIFHVFLLTEIFYITYIDMLIIGTLARISCLVMYS